MVHIFSLYTKATTHSFKVKPILYVILDATYICDYLLEIQIVSNNPITCINMALNLSNFSYI